MLGFAVSLAIAAWLKLREGYQVGGRVPGFLLFSLLESPRIVYAGVILGLAIGAFSIRKAGSETLFMVAFVAGGLLGVSFCLLQRVTNRWARMASSLVLAIGLIAGAWYGLHESSAFLQDQPSRNQAGILLLLGIPFFYLLTFAGSAEESEVEIGAMSALLGLAIVLLAWQDRSYQSS